MRSTRRSVRLGSRKRPTRNGANKLLTLPDGRVKLESKDDLKPRLGRSPDKLDALCMAVWAVVRPGRAMKPGAQPLHWG